jgi:hypothetical protein
MRPPLVGAALFAVAVLALPALAIPHDRRGVALHRDTRSELLSVDIAGTVAIAAEQTDGAAGLPATWCGNETGGDSGPAASAPSFKVVYAFAADRPDRFAGWSDALQADVALTERFLSAQDGGTKVIRFDMGTSCGPQYADIQVVALPGPRAAYAGDFSAITNAVQTALGTSTAPRDTVILADGLAPSTAEYGLGETYMGATAEQPGAANPHNGGGLRSVLFSRDGAPAPGNIRGGWWPEGFLHEITHNLGAVQWGAPHSTEPAGQSLPQYGHCWQGADVMCYVEDAGAAHAMQTDCPTIPGMITDSYDCGRDDYFNPAPAAGTYLTTHWNTYDSVFLARCTNAGESCGGDQLWVPTPPASTGVPLIVGSPRRGTPMRTNAGTWTNQPTTYAYQWQRLIAGGWEALDGATAARYVPAIDDVGHRLRVTVAAANGDGTAAATSAVTASVGAVAIALPTRASRRHPRRSRSHRTGANHAHPSHA